MNMNMHHHWDTAAVATLVTADRPVLHEVARRGVQRHMSEHDHGQLAGLCSDDAAWPVMICLLGNFRLLRFGEFVPIRAGGKREALLSYLALHYHRRVARERLVQAIWPANDLTLALNSLNNLVHSLHKLLGPALGGAAPVLHEEGYYRLNTQAGIGVDVVCFDALVEKGAQQMQDDEAAAFKYYRRAAELYRDDLCLGADTETIVERERLRARHLTLLAQLADHAYRAGGYHASLDYLWRLLARDPCREDAHRLIMRCYVQRGERAAALRHYQLCADLLRAEFDAPPEPATKALFDQIRLQPELN